LNASTREITFSPLRKAFFIRFCLDHNFGELSRRQIEIVVGNFRIGLAETDVNFSPEPEKKPSTGRSRRPSSIRFSASQAADGLPPLATSCVNFQSADHNGKLFLSQQ
jgi:hypothetical protein